MQAQTMQEMKRGGPGIWLSLVAFTVRNRFRGWTFFLPSFVPHGSPSEDRYRLPLRRYREICFS